MSEPDRDEIRSLNETVFAELSIDEIESRLEMEEMDPRGEMWTTCSCLGVCYGDVVVQNGGPHVCGAHGQW
jgi:hypothetical protein